MKAKIVGKFFTNNHTGQTALVTNMIWFNVQYKWINTPDYPPSYMHYKQFMKHFSLKGID